MKVWLLHWLFCSRPFTVSASFELLSPLWFNAHAKSSLGSSWVVSFEDDFRNEFAKRELTTTISYNLPSTHAKSWFSLMPFGLKHLRATILKKLLPRSQMHHVKNICLKKAHKSSIYLEIPFASPKKVFHQKQAINDSSIIAAWVGYKSSLECIALSFHSEMW